MTRRLSRIEHRAPQKSETHLVKTHPPADPVVDVPPLKVSDVPLDASLSWTCTCAKSTVACSNREKSRVSHAVVRLAAQLRAVQFSAGVQMSESWSPACATFSFLTKPQAFAGEHCSARGGAAARRRGGGGGEHRHEATKTRARVTTEV